MKEEDKKELIHYSRIISGEFAIKIEENQINKIIKFVDNHFYLPDYGAENYPFRDYAMKGYYLATDSDDYTNWTILDKYEVMDQDLEIISIDDVFTKEMEEETSVKINISNIKAHITRLKNVHNR